MTVAIIVISAFAGLILGFVLSERRRAFLERGGGEVLPADQLQIVDLLRRAHRADVATLVIGDEPPVTSTHPRGVTERLRGRCEAVTRLAYNDGRHHVAQEEDTSVAVGDGVVGAGLAFTSPEVDVDAIERALADLSRLAAGFHAQLQREQTLDRRSITPVWGIHDTYDSAIRAMCETARGIVDAPAALVIRDQVTQVARVAAVSRGADPRLQGTSAAPDSAAGRACVGDTPIVGLTAGELFGHPRTDRRRREERGIAFPLRDDRHRSFGALVVFQSPELVNEERRAALSDLTTEAGSEIAHLLQVHLVEKRALTDELTGLPNRRAFERVQRTTQSPPVALLCVDIDHFKAVNDEHGHVAGDAVLKHLARLFQRSLRDDDLAARMGGEEFVLWLPGTALAEARDVAERVRETVERSPCAWGAREIFITCSIGVAAVPESGSSIANLYSLADAALYRAKEAGRNRVETALAAEKPAGSQP
jgi:diguanylate cyclase (GGDEF)-like protein